MTMFTSINWKKLAVPVAALALFATACNGESDRNKAQSATTTTTVVGTQQQGTTSQGSSQGSGASGTGSASATSGSQQGTTGGATQGTSGSTQASGSTGSASANTGGVSANVPNFHGGSRNVGTSDTVTAQTDAPLPTGKAAFGVVPIDIPAGTSVVFEGFELGLNGEANKVRGPGIHVVNGPFQGTMWVHDGQVWTPQPTATVNQTVQNIRNGWALRTPPLPVVFCTNCP